MGASRIQVAQRRIASLVDPLECRSCGRRPQVIRQHIAQNVVARDNERCGTGSNGECRRLGTHGRHADGTLEGVGARPRTTCDIVRYVIAREAHLPADVICGKLFSLDQVVYGILADPQNRGHFVGRQGPASRHAFPLVRRGFIRTQVYTQLRINTGCRPGARNRFFAQTATRLVRNKTKRHPVMRLPPQPFPRPADTAILGAVIESPSRTGDAATKGTS